VSAPSFGYVSLWATAPDRVRFKFRRIGTPIIEICRVALDADGTPVEVNEMIADSSAYVFRYEFGA
jgi:hypothetical protein